jgi:beta-glucuronidase
MTEMIDRDQNRACVVFWSLGNETPKGEARNVFFRKMNDYVKEKDPTRLTTAALLFGAEEIQKVMKNYYIPSLMGKSFETWDIELDDTPASIVDVAAVNQYFGWYYSAFVSSILPVSTKKAREVMIANIPRIRFHVAHGKPLIISEMGAGAKKGFMADPIDMAVFSEDYQAQVYENQIRMVSEQTGLVGLSPWILKDFRSPIRLYQGVQDYWNLKGLVSNEGEKKKAFYTLQEFYKQ